MEDELTDRSYKLIRNIEEYILSNEDWPYYYLSTDMNVNTALLELIKDHPRDYEDYINFKVNSVHRGSVSVIITLDDDNNTTMNRWLNLATFEEAVERNKKLVEGRVKELQIEELKAEIKYHQEEMAKKEKYLKELS